MVPENLIVPRGVRKMLRPDNVRCALSHIAGGKAIEVFHALTFTEAEEVNIILWFANLKNLLWAKRLSPQTLGLQQLRPERRNIPFFLNKHHFTG